MSICRTKWIRGTKEVRKTLALAEIESVIEILPPKDTEEYLKHTHTLYSRVLMIAMTDEHVETINYKVCK